MTEYLFVYGLLKSDFDNPYAKALTRSAIRVGPAVFQGRLFLVDHYPAAVPSDDINDQVHGEVFQLDRPEILTELDAFEECGDQFPEPQEYRREKHDVCQPSGGVLSAWIYIFNRPTDGLKVLKNGRFVPSAYP